MRRNIKLILQYDGSEFSGWQRLNNQTIRKSIQSTLEEKLSEILLEPIKLIGSGRTDQGVHAFGQVANFYTESFINKEKLKKILNESLPESIAVMDIFDVDMDFHSRYHAKSKTYEYHIDRNQKACVFTRKYTLHHPEYLNIMEMRKAAQYLVGVHDFKAFSTFRKGCTNTTREIYTIQIEEIVKNEARDFVVNHKIRICINGNGFLYNMVRIIVGTLIEVGEGKKKAEDIKKILSSRKREDAGKTAEYQGLILKHVEY